MRPTAHLRKIRLRQFCIVGVVSLLTVACHSATSGNDTQPRPSADSGAAVANPGDPCAGGPDRCIQVGRADVDGDGQLDRIGVAVEKLPGRKRSPTTRQDLRSRCATPKG